MMAEKVACARCGNEILKTTADRRNGMCAPCAKGKPLDKPAGSKFGFLLKVIYSKIELFLTGAGLTLAGGGLAAFFAWNIYSGFLGDGWFFRYVYSPVFVLLCLLMMVAGLAFLRSMLPRR